MKKLLWLSIFLELFGPVKIAQAFHIDLELVPSSATVVVNEALTVEVTVSNLSAGGPPSVGAFDLNVSFNPLILEPISVDFGTFLGDPLLFEALTDFDLSAPGIVDFAAVSLLSSDELDFRQPASFTLAALFFTAIASGTSQFALVGDIRVDDASGNKLPIPEPTTLALLAVGFSGLGLVAILRKRYTSGWRA